MYIDRQVSIFDTHPGRERLQGRPPEAGLEEISNDLWDTGQNTLLIYARSLTDEDETTESCPPAVYASGVARPSPPCCCGRGAASADGMEEEEEINRRQEKAKSARWISMAVSKFQTVRLD